MIEFLDKNIKSAIINIQTIFKKVEESTIIMKDIEDTDIHKKDQIQTSRDITYDSWEEKYTRLY